MIYPFSDVRKIVKFRLWHFILFWFSAVRFFTHIFNGFFLSFKNITVCQASSCTTFVWSPEANHNKYFHSS